MSQQPYKPRTFQHTPYNATQSVPDVWVVVLNRYERDNLLDLLQSIQQRGDLPVSDFDTGDWVGMIRGKLAKWVEGSDADTPFRRVPVERLDADDNPNRRHVL